MKKTKMEKGITLIALIITIVVLLILAVVTINAIQGDGIIRYAQNAADDYTTNANQEQKDLNTLLGQIEGSLSEETKIIWTKTSEGNLAVGSTVVTSTGENFYVIGFRGTNNETVKLLAKNNLKADELAQDTTGEINPCAFSTVDLSEYERNDDLTNDTALRNDQTSALYKAYLYGLSLGVSSGRLPTVNEVSNWLDEDGWEIVYQWAKGNYWQASGSGEGSLFAIIDGCAQVTDWNDAAKVRS